MKKTLIIIGASGALGKGISEILLTKEYDEFYLVDIAVAPEFQHNRGFTFIKCGDLSIEESVQKVFESIQPDTDGLFLCYSTVGGYSGGKDISETDFSDWKKMFKINADTSFLIAKYFSRLASSSGGGSIIFTAAVTGVEPEEKKSAYGVSKAALIHLVKTLALEGKRYGMSANAIAPYILDTPENRRWVTDESQLTKPEEVAEIAHFIFSNFEKFTGHILSLKGNIEKRQSAPA